MTNAVLPVRGALVRSLDLICNPAHETTKDLILSDPIKVHHRWMWSTLELIRIVDQRFNV